MAPGPIVTMVGQGALLGMVYAMVSSPTIVACWLLVSHSLLHTVLTSLCALLYPLCLPVLDHSWHDVWLPAA